MQTFLSVLEGILRDGVSATPENDEPHSEGS